MLTTEEPFSQALSLSVHNSSRMSVSLGLCCISCAVCVLSRAQSVFYLARSLCCILRAVCVVSRAQTWKT